MRAVALVLDGRDVSRDALVPTQPHLATKAVLRDVLVGGVVVLPALERELEQLVIPRLELEGLPLARSQHRVDLG